MDRKELEKLSRAELVEKAEAMGVTRPRTLTMPELIDEILLAAERSTGQKKPRGWFGRARDLLTSVVDRGLTPDPRKAPARSTPATPPPLPTVTLAEIYAAQGHFERAIATLDEVIARDPAHDEAKKLRDRFADQLRRQRPSRPPEGLTAAALTPELGGDPKTPAATGVTAEALTPEIQPGAAPTSTTVETPPPPPEPAPDLADRYDVDEVVAIAVDPHTVYAYWEVRAATLAPLRNAQPDGALSLRVLIVSAEGAAPSPRGPAGPVSDARDVRVDAAIGELFVRDLPANAEIRVAIGWRTSAGEFQPVAVGLDLATPREAPASQVAVRFGRMAAGGIAEPYDALRASGLLGGRGAPTFHRPTPEEISLGHAAAPDPQGDRFAVAGGERDFSETVERVERPQGTAEIVTRIETRRLGASELLTRESVERRFLGASENVRPARSGDARSRDVSFGLRRA